MKFGKLKKIKWEILFLTSHTENVVEKLVPDPFQTIKVDNVSGSTV